MARIELAPDYLLAHFNEFLQRFEPLYFGLLDEQGRQWLASYHQLPVDAKRLLLRLLSRKGPVFAKSELHYAEISDLELAMAALLDLGWLVHALGAQDPSAVLQKLTKPQLWQLLSMLPEHPNRAEPKKSADKASLVTYLSDHPADWPPLLSSLDHFVCLTPAEPLHYMMFLFFGDSHQDLSALVLRDLGVLPTRHFKQQFSARYVDAATAQAAYFYSASKARFRALLPKKSSVLAPLVFDEWFEAMATWPTPLDERAELHHEQLCFELGRQAERLGLFEQSVACYQRSQSFPANERLLRLYQQRRDRVALETQLERMLTDPSCDEELAMAQDFAARLGRPRQLSDITLALRQAELLTLDDLFVSDVEQGVVAHYQQHGKRAWHTENDLWLALFGLWFWQELFEADDAALHSEFDWRPRDLTTGTFYSRQQAVLDSKLLLLSQPQAAQRFLLQQFAHAAQRPNAIFRFTPHLLEQLHVLLDKAPTGSLAALLLRMAKDFRRYSRGYPDLLVEDENGLTLVEVKAPGDVLRRHQWTRLQTLQQLGFQVAVQRVAFGYDAATMYAVVDVETTGGRATHDRITEIAIVRVQGGKVVDRFAQLVNPQRHIPSFISRLTGISNAMVATAPTFAEVAEALLQRLQGCIFVAHNAKFDVGFVKQEFARAGVSWRAPQLCTVVQSRRYFPRLPSYGLAALAAHFGLTLTEHHRALADAEATAELLLLIQAQQQELARAALHICQEAEPQLTDG